MTFRRTPLRCGGEPASPIIRAQSSADPRFHARLATPGALDGGALRADRGVPLLSRRAPGEEPRGARDASPSGSDMDLPRPRSSSGPSGSAPRRTASSRLTRRSPSPYTGPHSLQRRAEAAISGPVHGLPRATGRSRTTELILDREMAVGGGLSQALGVAGFTNLDVVRNPSLSHEPYVARARDPSDHSAVARLGAERGSRPDLLVHVVPRHRLELRVGKMSTADSSTSTRRAPTATCSS